MIIGLAGGSPEDRQAIANRLISIENGPALWEWAVDAPHGTRAASLEAYLQGRHRLRRQRGKSVGLIYTHVLVEDEARALRAAGGVIWHVRGIPSRLVMNRHGDLQVTVSEDGDEHALGPAEALSEFILQRRSERHAQRK